MRIDTVRIAVEAFKHDKFTKVFRGIPVFKLIYHRVGVIVVGNIAAIS